MVTGRVVAMFLVKSPGEALNDEVKAAMGTLWIDVSVAGVPLARRPGGELRKEIDDHLERYRTVTILDCDDDDISLLVEELCGIAARQERDGMLDRTSVCTDRVHVVRIRSNSSLFRTEQIGNSHFSERRLEIGLREAPSFYFWEEFLDDERNGFCLAHEVS